MSADSASRLESPGRHLKIAGTYNVRDIGGYETADGRRTRWRIYLRADSLHKVPAAAQRELLDTGLRRIIDLRRGRGLAETPNVFARSDGVDYRHLNLITDTDPDGYGDPGEGPAWIAQSYRLLIDNRKAQIGVIMGALAEPRGVPALFHCAGGADRTGIIAALLLGLARVPEETIAADYHLTAPTLVKRYAEDGPPPGWSDDDLRRAERLDYLAPAETMRIALQHLRESYGGVEGYVREIGLLPRQIESIRGLFVE